MGYMRRIGGHVSAAGGVLNAIQNTLDIGGNCLQIFAGSPRSWARSLYEEKVATEFRVQAEKHDLSPIYVHALYLTNLAAEDANIRAKSKQALIYDMRNAAKIGAKGVVVHIGSHLGRGWEKVREMVREEIVGILEETPKETNFLLENDAGQQGKIGDLEELAFLIGELENERVRVCLDSAHTLAAGHEIRTKSGLEQYIMRVEETVGWGRVDVLHINDSKVDLGGKRDVHENIGEGFVGKAGFEVFLNHPALRHLPLILEVPGFGGKKAKGPDKRNVDLVRSLVS